MTYYTNTYYMRARMKEPWSRSCRESSDPRTCLLTLRAATVTHPPVLEVQVQRRPRVVHGRVLALLDGQSQVRCRQLLGAWIRLAWTGDVG